MSGLNAARVRIAVPRGVSIVEALVALVVAAVVLTAVWALLLTGWRNARAQTAAVAVRQTVRAAAVALRAELLGAVAPAGDLLRVSDSALTLRAMRGLGFVCAHPAGVAVAIGDSLFSGTRAVDPSRDSALVFREGDPLRSDDDRWLRAGISSTRGASCEDGSRATLLVLAGPTAEAMAGVGQGAPVRTFEVLEYRRYQDADHVEWLGVHGPASGGGWASLSPIAGPLRAPDGVVFRFTDRLGQPTADPAGVALVEISIRGLDPRLLQSPGRLPRPTVDSAVVRVFVGGP